MTGVFVARTVYDMLKAEGPLDRFEVPRNCVVPVDGKGRATCREQNNQNPVTIRSLL